jgi:hypothetical protein
MGALFGQSSTPHILLSRAPKKERTPGFPKSQRFPTGSFLIRIPPMTFVPSIFYFSFKESKQAFQSISMGKQKGGENT